MSALVNNGPAYFKPGNLVQTGVLGQSGSVLASAGDVTLATGVMTFSNGVSIKVSSITGYVITPYTLGAQQVSALDLTSITVADNTVYKITFMTLNDDQVYTSTVISGTGATAASIAAQFQQFITNNTQYPVKAAVIGNVLILTEISNSTGGFQVSAPTGAVLTAGEALTMGAVTGTFQVGETVTQATSAATGKVGSITTVNGATVLTVYAVTGTFDTTHVVTGGTSGATSTPSSIVVSAVNVQSSGSQFQVSVLTSIQPPLTTGQYRLYAMTYSNPVPNSQIGGKLTTTAQAWLWINESATNFAALDTQIKAILAGTATPASGYLGAI